MNETQPLPTNVAMVPCDFCGMPCTPNEYHPYAACLMFKACHKSDTVRANLEAVRGNPAPVGVEPVAWMRKWAFDRETPAKVKNEAGRLAWPQKFKLRAVTENRCLSDDMPLFTAPQPTQAQAGAVPPPWMEPDAFFGGRPPRAMDIDSEDFYGITEAIHHALEMLGEHDDANTDASPLDPKRSRRLCQALMAAWMLEYPREAAAHGIKGGQHGAE